MNLKVTVPLCVTAAALRAGAVMVVGDANTSTVVTPTETIITATQNATLTVTDPGEIEILLVGGGGGAGGLSSSASGYNSGDSRGGGGGGGGVIHRQNFNVETGRYDIVVGAGGVFCTSANSTTVAIGGSTSGFGLTALGGGPGGWIDPEYNSYTVSNLGASGGGGSKSPAGKAITGGTALASDANGNLGHNGANASDYKNGGGGGGAVGAGAGAKGGDGYACNISGETVHYGGGGGGGRRYSAAEPGLGGGKSNYGGGGSGQSAGINAPESGGPGIAIVRFTRTEQKTSSDFKVSGYGTKGDLEDGYRYLVIANDTTLHVTGTASLDVLLVGGGGGAGGSTDKETGYTGTDNRGGGGGGGGVIHLRNIPVAAGDYAITVGLGGVVNTTGSAANLASATGGSTTGFGFTALGGGPGAPVNGAGSSVSGLGASGGGGSTTGGSTIISGGTALASGANFNLGNNGADATSAKIGGGGGGAGAAASGVAGGDGYACDITGTTVYYGGGGKGGERYATSATPGQGGGKANYGGGGSAQIAWSTPESGGHGIVIIRYKRHVKGIAIRLR